MSCLYLKTIESTFLPRATTPAKIHRVHFSGPFNQNSRIENEMEMPWLPLNINKLSISNMLGKADIGIGYIG